MYKTVYISNTKRLLDFLNSNKIPKEKILHIQWLEHNWVVIYEEANND